MSKGDTIILKPPSLIKQVLPSGVGFLTGNGMSSVVAFVSRFSQSRAPQFFFFHCSCRISIFLTNYGDEGPPSSEVGVFAYRCLSWPLYHHSNTNNKSNTWQTARMNSRRGNMRPSAVTSLTSASARIICWWKTYLDCMNNNILCLTLCCDMHFIYWPRLDFCIDFTDTARLRRFFMDFPAAIPNDPLWSLSARPSGGKAWKTPIIFAITLYLAPVLYAAATRGRIVVPRRLDWPVKKSFSISGSHARGRLAITLAEESLQNGMKWR